LADHQHSYRREAVYVYHDESGKPIYRKVKKRCECGSKTYTAQRRIGNAETYVNGMGPVSPTLYNLHLLYSSQSFLKGVWLVEGEKDAETLVSLGYVALSYPNGALSWSPDYAVRFRGLDRVFLVADNDAAGMKNLLAVKKDLDPLVGEVRILLPTRGKDVTEMIELGDTVEEMFRASTGHDLVPAPSITDGLAKVFQLAKLRDGDPIYGPAEIPVANWANILPTMVEYQRTTVAAKVVPLGTVLDPYEVPVRCGGCNGYLTSYREGRMNDKPYKGRPCYRCREVYSVTELAPVDG